MPFASQFSLSLELTRLVPLALAASSKAAEEVMSLARNLRNSGSDIIIEEDLVSIFGRCRIETNLDRSFRTIVATSMSTPLYDAITLESGPGPTVLRGLKQTPYFAMVVQCSLLTWIHEKTSLAASLSAIFELENEKFASQNSSGATPSQEGILGVPKACEEQTASFDWNAQLFAIAHMLSINDNKAFQPIPITVFRGCVYMFPMVQILPEDRFILIETDRGVSALVAWAHVVLGLTVVVCEVKHEGQNTTPSRTKFGNGQEQVLIEVDSSKFDPSIALLETSSNEEFIKLQPGPDEREIEESSSNELEVLATRYLCP